MNDRCPGGGDYDTPEQTHGSFNMEQPWEAAITLCTQWAWKPNDSMKSLDQCLGLLIACAGRNGNLLFNTGPMPDGRIEPRQAERLREMGAWLAKYGVSIYGTRGGPFRNGRYGVSTRKDKTIYLHVLNWTPDTLEFPAIPARIVASSALTGGKPTVKQTDDGIEVFLPPGDRQKPDTIVALELDRPALELPSQWVQAWKRSLTFGKLASASSAAKGQAADKALDRVEKTSWAADAGAKQAWLEVNLGKPETITRAEIVETHPGRVQRFELQAKDGEEWKTFHAGTNLGANCSLTFAPVTAQFVRLNLPAAAAGPAITEFHLFAK
jgi:alpha-L-fucosidase